MSSLVTDLKPSHRNYNNHYAKQRGFPNFQRPHIVASFSVDASQNCIPNDRSQLSFVRRCPSSNQKVNLDLGAGYEFVIKKPVDPSEEKLDHLLRVLVDDLPKYRNNNTDEKQKLRADVIAWRGLLRLLMTTPYEDHESWSVLATRFGGSIYLMDWKSEKQVAAKSHMKTPEMQRILSYGFKFEQYRQTKRRNQEPSDTSGPVNEAEEFGCVLESSLDGTRLLYGAEMDGVDEEEDVDLDTVDLNKVRFVELKVNRRPQNPQQQRNMYKFKVRNWWAQCFLGGVEQVQVGVRNDAGIVDEIYNTSLKELLNQSKGLWMPAVCMQFLDDFLRLVQSKMKDVNCPHSVYLFDFDPQEDRRVHLTTFHGPNVHSFLPDWYIKAI